MLVREIMTRQLVRVTRGTSVKEAFATRDRINANWVTDTDEAEGAVSEAELIQDVASPQPRTHHWASRAVDVLVRT